MSALPRSPRPCNSPPRPDSFIVAPAYDWSLCPYLIYRKKTGKDDNGRSVTRLYHGQVVWLEWQSWHERSRITPTCGLTICAMWIPVVSEVLGIVAVGTNCIPRKTKANKIEVSLASLRMLLFLLTKMATQVRTSSDLCELFYLPELSFRLSNKPESGIQR